MIGLDQIGGLLVITLRRADKANALTKHMLETLEAAVASIGPDIRAVILTGEGRVFSAGADLDEARAGLAVDPVWGRLSSRLAALPCLTIAALNGTLAGGAMALALACDVRIAVPAAKFFYPVMRLGFLPQPDDPARLAALIGPSRAKLMLMAGAKIDTYEALSWGLIDRIIEPHALMTTARDLAADVLLASADHLAIIKSMLP